MDRKRKLPGKGRHVCYLIAASGMLFYALTQLGQSGEGGAAHLFWYVWLGFTAVIIAANVNMLLMSEGKRREMARIKCAKAQRWERALEKRIAKRSEVVQRTRGRG
ncbi:hypothetical protein D3P07_03350 [Paenibacillus sp. 1011MAR3C5]|uniref:hypothetical protein n=1 Tax=Paenibacillus sp. 1011MAR3C5 TaxID=1675787 RepID=UPI000E6C5C78|nr:hypothetical protein [Paenibacillus sp. 1011MAR3C5]RJE91119.1 hypothetical protein D3P07_03350 [Paenibacillus sp. 1011MAR3C5]